jgi:hypothetical protein
MLKLHNISEKLVKILIVTYMKRPKIAEKWRKFFNF